ncbi:MAG: right-handed parallel beta-helix repeat-containing protein [Armatimonadota bacterium]
MTTCADGITLYVAPDGNDTWSGRQAKAGEGDGPFASLERARDEIRRLKQAGGLPEGGVTVEVAGGIYERAGSFELTAEDSGTDEAPILYRAARGAEVRLIGGKRVTGFTPVTDRAILARLEESARGKVYQADLRALGITDYGSPGGGGLEVFYKDKPMTISRWPNEGFVRIVDILNLDPVDVRGTKGDKVGKFVYEGDRPSRWLGEKDLWLHGYWFWDWSDQRQKVESIDTEKRIISLVPPYHNYGYRKGQWYYAFNALCEVDMPGEWYLDRETGTLYFYPPGTLSDGDVVVSVLPTLVTMKEVSNVTLRGFTMEAARGTAITIEGGTQCRIVGCTIRDMGGKAVSISGGTRNGVVGCDVYDLGDGGVVLSGGDRKTLTPAGHYAENNHIHHYGRIRRMYSAGISLNGVGNRASHNLIHNAPHQAMSFGGNDHLIEFNEIHSVCYESNDAGAIYAGRDWTMRGNVIRHNYLHHINGFEGRGCVGVYLDDMFSSADIVGNLFYRVTRAAFIGGGRDCRVENNIFVDCTPALHVDARALNWAYAHADGWLKEAAEKGTLSGIAFNQPPYSERYPALARILEGQPKAPEGNVIARNICWGGKWDEIEGAARPFLTFEDNLIQEDPGFVDYANGNFQLREDSPAYRLGFKRIPIEKIGLYKDPRRASWPVEHQVREMPTPPPPPKPARTGPPRVYQAQRLRKPVVIDGVIKPEEGWEADAARALVLEEGVKGEKVGPPSLAWVVYDDEALYVGMDNTVDASKALRMGNTWGQDDAVEIALQNVAAGKDAPILVLRGYPSGHFESSDEAGAPKSAVERAAQGVEYKASVVDSGRWIAEWRIPFASLGIDPTKQRRFAFNLSVHKTAPEPFWLLWQGTGAWTWYVQNAGFLELGQ